ncbi:MAG TPA: hypothetical protein EYP98_14335 [Planctomycetes bacterium]|nr:hypothetical protein [Planctomycetota bacterium]
MLANADHASRAWQPRRDDGVGLEPWHSNSPLGRRAVALAECDRQFTTMRLKGIARSGALVPFQHEHLGLGRNDTTLAGPYLDEELRRVVHLDDDFFAGFVIDDVFRFVIGVSNHKRRFDC